MKFKKWLWCLLLIGGCSFYRVPVIQGNYLRKDMINQLAIGQTKKEVREILGDAILSPLQQEDEWIYLFVEKDRSKTPTERKYRVVIKFNKRNRVQNIYVQS